MKIFIIFESKNAAFNQLYATLNFIDTQLDSSIVIDCINIMEDKKKLKMIIANQQISRKDLLCLIEYNNEMIPFYEIDNAVDFILTNQITSNTNQIKDIDTVIFGSGAASLMAAHELVKQGQKVIVLDNQNFGRSVITDGINMDNPFINEIYSPMIINNALDNVNFNLFMHRKVSSAIVNYHDETKFYSIEVSDVFSITSKNIIIGDTLSPKLLHIDNEQEMMDTIIFNLTDSFNSLVGKKVVIVGDYEIAAKVKILEKIAKKVTHVPLINSKLTPIRIFDKDGKISALLAKHETGYSKPIKCEAIVYSTGYENDSSLDFLRNIPVSDNLYTINTDSSNMVDLIYHGRKTALTILDK